MRDRLTGWFRSLRHRRKLDGLLDEEIQFHLDAQIEKNRQAGMSPDEARRQALVRFGGVQRTRESARDQVAAASLEHVLRDVRYGVRALLRARSFSLTAVLTLALGFGATTAMFSVVNGILLRPLPYPNQERLVELVHEAPGMGIDELLASPAVYFTYRDSSLTFESVGLWDWDASPVTVTGIGDPESVRSVEVTHEVLAMLGAAPVIGRGFSEADDQPGSPPTAVISYAYWQRRFGGTEPLGQALVVEGVPRQVIGVLPPAFRFFDYPADLFYPLQLVRSEAVFPSADGRGVALLKEGVTLAQANADVERMIPILGEEFGSAPEDARFGPRLRWLKDAVVGDLRDTLWLLMGTIGLLLLIACANVANLVLVRVQARRPELAIRAALGAGWRRIAGVVVTESVILGLVGGALGLAVAYVSLPLLLSFAAADLPQIMAVAIDSTVVLVTLGASGLAALVFALVSVLLFAVPQFRLSRALHGDGRAVTEGREGHRARHGLMVSQVALALVLLIGAGLMARTFQTLRQVDPGFRDPRAVQTFQLTIPATSAGPGDAERMLRTQQAILDRFAAVGGVQSAGFSAFNDGLPLDGDGRGVTITIEGRPPFDDTDPPKEVQFVSPGFFAALGTPLIAGRTVDWNDIYQGRRVALVSENLARAEWGSSNAALGARISPQVPNAPWFDIVGVVGDVHHNGLEQPAPEVVVFPAAILDFLPGGGALASDTASFVVRSERAGTADFLDELRAAIWSVNPTVTPANLQTLGDLYQRSMARSSMTLLLLAITGTMALLLGLVGIYGLVTYTVAQRRREIGIRLALGGSQTMVRRMFVRQALVLVGVGVAVGLGAAAGLTRLMTSQLFGVAPLDPATHLTVAVGLMAAAGLASYFSAWRAATLDPVEVLKGE